MFVGVDAHIDPPSNGVLSYAARADTPRVLAPLRFAGVWASAPTKGQGGAVKLEKI